MYMDVELIHPRALTSAPAAAASSAAVSRSSPVPPPTLPPFEVVERHDVSAGSGAKRLELRVELRRWPVTYQQVEGVAMRVIEAHRGQGWQALAVRIAYDRQEVVPSFAVLEWAPGGRWEDAASGDGRTWQGYALHVTVAQHKLVQPEECIVPDEQAYQLNDEFNQRTLDNLDYDEATVLAQIAARHHLPTAFVEQQIVAVETWTMC